jgi:hypothetical protein
MSRTIRGQELDGAVRRAVRDGATTDTGTSRPSRAMQHGFARPQTVAEQGRQDLVLHDRAQPLGHQAGDRQRERTTSAVRPRSDWPAPLRYEEPRREVRDRDQVGRDVQDRRQPLARLELLAQLAVEPRVLNGHRA